MGYPVEIKANVEQGSIDDALSKLELEDDAAEKRSIYFCENRGSGTPLNEQGVILRVRRNADDSDKSDITLKLRPCLTAKLPSKWSAPSEGAGWEFRIEQDWSGDQDPVVSASLVREVARADADKVLNGAPAELVAVLSGDQLKLCQDYTGVPLDSSTLRALGPVESRKWKFKLGERKVNGEEWVIPDTAIRFLELSDREDDPNQAKATRQTLLDLYEAKGLKLSTSPEMKTKIVLDHFARDLEAHEQQTPEPGDATTAS